MTTRGMLRIGQAIALTLLVLTTPALAEDRIERDLALNPGSRLALEADGGSVTVTGGSIRIAGAGDRVEADTSGGPIEVSFAPGAEVGGSLSTSGGGVRVWLDRNANIEIDAATSGGSVHCDLPITIQGRTSKTSLKGTIGAGGPRLTVRSSGGSIRIGEPGV